MTEHKRLSWVQWLAIWLVPLLISLWARSINEQMSGYWVTLLGVGWLAMCCRERGTVGCLVPLALVLLVSNLDTKPLLESDTFLFWTAGPLFILAGFLLVSGGVSLAVLAVNLLVFSIQIYAATRSHGLGFDQGLGWVMGGSALLVAAAVLSGWLQARGWLQRVLEKTNDVLGLLVFLYIFIAMLRGGLRCL